jgi:hypothetical protein
MEDNLSLLHIVQTGSGAYTASYPTSTGGYFIWINLPELETDPLCLVPMSRRPPVWSNGQSSWLRIQRHGFDSRRYQII